MASVRSIGIVGCGNVGIAGAFASMVERIASEIVLVDLNRARAEVGGCGGGGGAAATYLRCRGGCKSRSVRVVVLRD